ncbi:MAG: J domain-containing protein [Myxococcota bacterium]
MARAAEARRRAETVVGPPPEPPPQRQKSLLERMNEALRQSVLGAAPNAAPAAPADGKASSRDDRTDPHYAVPPGFLDPNPPRKPLVLGGRGQDAEEADLWNIVQPTSPKAPPPSAVQSFEEALRRVDSSLEALVGEVSSSSDRPEPLVEAIVEGEIEAPASAKDAARMEDFEVGDPSDPAEAARLRRQRLLRRAMENLGAIQPQAPRTEGAQVVSPTQPELAAAPAASSSPSGAHPAPSASDLQLASQIDQRFEAIAKKDHFLTLGVAPSATRDQVKSAFLALAKVFHPDRLPPSLPQFAHKMSAVFESIRDAYETLYDDQKRSAYLASRTAAQAGAPPAAAQQASDLMKMGEVFFKKRDYRQAETHFMKAHAIDKGANSLAAAAWSIYMDPTRKAEAGEARMLMQKALTIDANCDRAHYQLGVIARVEGDMDTAERHFREAVRVNPRHLEANQELRLIEMRKKKDTTKKGGFFR